MKGKKRGVQGGKEQGWDHVGCCEDLEVFFFFFEGMRSHVRVLSRGGTRRVEKGLGLGRKQGDGGGSHRNSPGKQGW